MILKLRNKILNWDNVEGIITEDFNVMHEYDDNGKEYSVTRTIKRYSYPYAIKIKTIGMSDVIFYRADNYEELKEVYDKVVGEIICSLSMNSQCCDLSELEVKHDLFVRNVTDKEMKKIWKEMFVKDEERPVDMQEVRVDG